VGCIGTHPVRFFTNIGSPGSARFMARTAADSYCGCITCFYYRASAHRIWVNFIHQHISPCSMDTMTGYHLMNHAGLFFEDVPDKYAGIRDTFIRYQDDQVALTGKAGNAIWDAIPEMMQVSGLGFNPLSILLGRTSLRHILQHPGQYLLSVGEGWLAFWKVPVHWTLISSLPSTLEALQRVIILLLRGVIFLANLAFIAGSLALFWKKAGGPCTWWL